MFITNGMKAKLLKRNRCMTGVYDDEFAEAEDIVLCPYNADIKVAFGVYTIPEAEGYFIVKNTADIKEGDQIFFQGRTFSVLKVKDNWIWNKIANFTIAVK